MRKRSFAIPSAIIAVALLLSACGGPESAGPAEGSTSQELRGTIAISGAFALYPMMTVWAEEFSVLHPGVQFDVQGGGAGKGMTDTLAGGVDIGMISRAIKPEEESQGAFWVAVAKDAVFPIVSADNPFLADLTAQGISQEAVGKIFVTDEFKTWGEVLESRRSRTRSTSTRARTPAAREQWALFSGTKAQSDLRESASTASRAWWTQSAKTLWDRLRQPNSSFDASTASSFKASSCTNRYRWQRGRCSRILSIKSGRSEGDRKRNVSLAAGAL
jgi:phosphate transport system substrate-binding protein